jgi:hypothetical protein
MTSTDIVPEAMDVDVKEGRESATEGGHDRGCEKLVTHDRGSKEHVVRCDRGGDNPDLETPHC